MVMFELAIILAGAVLVIFLMSYVSRSSRGLDKKYYAERWKKIEETSVLGDSGMRMAVIDGDKLVDHALKKSHVRGETMGERLKTANYMKNIDNLWSAHKLRNKLVHEPDVKARKNEMKRAINAYRKSLKELGAL